LTLVVGMTGIARADDPAYLADGAYFALTAENTDSDLELGMSFAPSTALRIKPYARVPFSDSDAHRVRVDGHAQAAKVGIGVDFGTDWTEARGPGRFLVVGGQLELGTSVYDFEPLGAMAVSERHQSFSGGLHARYGLLWTKLQLAPQLTVAYDRSFSAADPVGVVIPGSGGAPETVQTMVVDPPSTVPVLTLRFGTPWYVGQIHAPIAFGTYLVASLAGTTDTYQPWSDADLVRGEVWTYLFVHTPVNARAGLAVFAEAAHASSDASTQKSYGLLVQLKANTTLFEY
jgi:hypothetical protein